MNARKDGEAYDGKMEKVVLEKTCIDGGVAEGE